MMEKYFSVLLVRVDLKKKTGLLKLNNAVVSRESEM